ncbi:MAG: FhaA domain-containing protein [Solirubrobacteraceae bacterium]
MSLLRNLESKIEGLVEGTFGRVFRSEVRPIELARKLVREMDENRVSSVARVYAPHEYDIWLSPADRDRYEGIEGEVIDELAAYLLEHARREELVLRARPSIAMHTDDSLELGEFGIETQPPRIDGEEESEEPAAADAEREPSGERRARDWLSEPQPPEELAAGHTMIYSGSRRLREPLEQSPRRRDREALLIVAGEQLLVPPSGAVIGRSRECDIVLQDNGVSRRHAEIRPSPGGWTVADLGSTNGLRLRGRPVRGIEQLRPGDRLELGSTEIVFELR